jgi:hypothetical protein
MTARVARRQRPFAGRPKPSIGLVVAHSSTALPDPRGLANAEIAELEIEQRRRHDDEEYRAWLHAVIAEHERRGGGCL